MKNLQCKLGWIGVLLNSVMLIVNSIWWKPWMIAASVASILLSWAAIWLFASGTTRSKQKGVWTEEQLAILRREAAKQAFDNFPKGYDLDAWCPLCGQQPCVCLNIDEEKPHTQSGRKTIYIKERP